MKNQLVLGLFFSLLLLGCSQDPALAPDPVLPTAAAVLPNATATPAALAEAAADPAVAPTLTLTPIPTLTATPTVVPSATPLPPRLIESTADGRLRYVYAEERFALTLPANWSVVDYLAVTEVGVAEQSELAAELLSSALFVDLIEDGLRFYALNTGNASLSSVNPPTVLLVNNRLAGGQTFDGYVQQTVAALQANPQVTSAPAVVDTGLTLPAGAQGTRINHTFEAFSPTGETLTLSSAQQIVVFDGEVYVLTATWSAGDTAAVQGEINEVLNSLEIR